MPGLDPKLVEHHLVLKPDCKPIKQKLRKMDPRVAPQVKEGLEELLKAGFIRTIEYPDWLANIVAVPKKNGKVRICIDFRDLNKATPKDDYPLPNIDLLIDSTADHAMFSFMDGYSGYNQIKLAARDQSKTSFHYALGYILLYGYAVRAQECWGNLSESNDSYLSRPDAQEHGCLCG